MSEASDKNAVINSDVAVVSAFGRGHWLASELKKRGMNVVLLDVTSHLGVTSLEDGEGPFGFFHSEKFTQSQLERMLEDDEPLMVKNGFTVWLKSGPLELKGPLSKYKLEKLGISESILEYISRGVGNPRNLINEEFKKNWLAHLAHGMASTTYTPSVELLQQGEPLPLFSDFMVRQASRQGMKKSLSWCLKNGVEVFENVRILDVATEQSQGLRVLEFKGESTETSHLLRAHQFIWSLNSEESLMMSKNLEKKLFPEGALEPDWIWIRYRIKMSSCSEREQLPLHFLMIEDIELPWTHENFCLIQRTGSNEQFDVWIRIPSVQRFNRQYLMEKRVRILKILSERLPLAYPDIVEDPQGADHTYQQLGPSRQPVYMLSSKKRLVVREYPNLHMDSSEQWDHLGWDGIFSYQKKILDHLIVWWQKKEETRIRYEIKEQNRVSKLQDKISKK